MNQIHQWIWKTSEASHFEFEPQFIHSFHIETCVINSICKQNKTEKTCVWRWIQTNQRWVNGERPNIILFYRGKKKISIHLAWRGRSMEKKNNPKKTNQSFDVYVRECLTFRKCLFEARCHPGLFFSMMMMMCQT